MTITGDSSAPYFYLNLPIIYQFGVLISFTPFEADFLATINVAPYQITPNVWSILRAFQIIYYNLGVSHIVWVFLFFFGVEILPICSWINLHSLSGRNLLQPYVLPYEDWKDRFVRVRGRDNAYTVTTEGNKLLLLPSIMDNKSLAHQRDILMCHFSS